ncbi:MAG TPA: TRAP transporter substrate-binding protein [Kiritimatiellia bacterium]|jgi:TRAP-type mannitol/chloroaromatic compound transport system substrate-binding protein
MKRREFLKKSVPAALAGGVLAGCAKEQAAGGPAADAQPSVDWRMVSSYPRNLDTLFGATEFFAKRVEELTGGKFRIRSYPAGELVPALQVMDAVQQGTVQAGHTASYYYTGKNPVLAFDTCVPFGLTSRQQNAWMFHGGGLALIREAYAAFNIINFPGGSTGAQMGGWFRSEITSLESLKGLKMRIPGLGGEVMSRLGVTVQTLPGSEIYLALERGAIDATEWVGPYDDEKLGLHKICKNYYYPGWWEPGPVISFIVNLDAWNKLPAVYQRAVETASAETSQWMTADYDFRNPAALRRLVEGGVKLAKFPDDMMAAAEKIAFEIMEELASKDAGYAKVYENWKKFRADSYVWFGTCELAYEQFAFPRAR